MKRFFTIIASGLMVMSLATGCLPSREATGFVNNPQFVTYNTADIYLDLSLLYQDTLDAFGVISQTPYGFVYDVQMDADNSTKEIYLYVELVEEASATDAEHMAVALLRHLDDAASDQYPDNFEKSTPESFGNLYDYYSVYINAAKASDDTVIYALSIEAGDEIDLDPDMESYEEEWQTRIDEYLDNEDDPSSAESAGVVIIEETEPQTTSEGENAATGSEASSSEATEAGADATDSETDTSGDDTTEADTTGADTT